MTTPPLDLGAIRIQESELPVMIGLCVGSICYEVGGLGVGVAVGLKTWRREMSLSDMDGVVGRSKMAAVF